MAKAEAHRECPPATDAQAKIRRPIGTRLRFEILKRDGFKCRYCGSPPRGKALHIDHVVPVALGGSNDPSNLVAACADCNLGKSSVPLAMEGPP